MHDSEENYYSLIYDELSVFIAFTNLFISCEMVLFCDQCLYRKHMFVSVCVQIVWPQPGQTTTSVQKERMFLYYMARNKCKEKTKFYETSCALFLLETRQPIHLYIE